MPERRADGFFLDMEQFHLPAKTAVVALFGFLQHVEIGFKLLLVRPGGTVNTLQHFVIGITPPIGTGEFHQFKMLAELARRGQMRSPAEINPIALTIDRNVITRRDCFDQLGFIGFAFSFKKFDGLIAIPNFTEKFEILVNDLRHFIFNGFKVIGRKRFITGKIIIIAVFDRGTDGNLGAWKKFLNGLRHHMGSIVAQ